jgi:hypothetical protein
MPAAADFAPADAERFYADYVECCRRLGVVPVPPERASDLLAAWSALFAAASATVH